MRAEWKMWSDVSKPFSGKVTFRPETPEEERAMRMFKEHVGARNRGRKLEVVYKRRLVGPRQIGEALKGVGERGS